MCDRHQILNFIGARLDDTFSGRTVWDSVKEHHYGNQWNLPILANGFKCSGCNSFSYPCPYLIEVASYFKEHENFDPDWTLGSGEGNLEA